jgi:hypothetical protein
LWTEGIGRLDVRTHRVRHDRKPGFDLRAMRLLPRRQVQILAQALQRLVHEDSGGIVATSNSTPPGSRKSIEERYCRSPTSVT